MLKINKTSEPNFLKEFKKKEKPNVTAPLFGSGDLFTQPVLDQLLKLDIMSMTPIEAISELYRLQEEAKQGGGK